ncbi:MAG: tandem-95 repeat protein, partial [Planctomycetales bacterium]|nr:tandem-95 repeat protein [Planctomycetales bacterium]
DDLSPNVRVVTPPAYGQLDMQADGSFTYLPAPDYNGTDAFTYAAYDGVRTSNMATVELLVTGINDAPWGRNDFFFTRPDTRLELTAETGVLANDIDVDRTQLTVELASAPLHGVLTLNPDGSLLYVPANGFRGIDRFTYRINDGVAVSNATTATLSVNPQQLLISEVAASVDESFTDYDDNGSDWIEITNYDSQPIDMRGWYLTDDAERPKRWQVPVTQVIEPGASLVIVASGKDFVAPTGELHTNFRLSSDGEYLGLIAPDGQSVVWETATAFPALNADVSWGMANVGLTESVVGSTSSANYQLTEYSDTAPWTSVAFDDTSWSSASASIGYATTSLGTFVPGFSTEMRKVVGGRIWSLSSADAAESLFTGTADPLDYV